MATLLIFEKKDNLYSQMLVHHLATIFSILYAYFTNHEDFSVYVMLVSNFADIFVNLGRYLRNVGSSGFAVNLGYVLLFLSWLITRVISMPICFYQSSNRLHPFKKYPFDDDGKYAKVW